MEGCRLPRRGRAGTDERGHRYAGRGHAADPAAQAAGGRTDRSPLPAPRSQNRPDRGRRQYCT
ncbi:hypothetical protein AKJ13_14660 [Methylobacterium sp. ARG-1]|nr:hypothetical protein AKJ13_14660 [Methylobacterium sp. ARG-1]